LQRFANAGRLASALSRDLLGALGVAQTDVGFLCDLVGDPSRQNDLRDAAHDARAAIARAVGHIAAVLSLARERQGEAEPLDVKETLLAALFDLDARLARFTLVCDLSPVPLALAERGGLLQVLVSVLLDAAEASPRRGHIGVSLRSDGGEVLLSVEDEGPSPIAAESLADRVQATLWICRKLVRSFGGELTTGIGTRGGRRVTIRLQSEPAR
jgi:two-component system sensor histidine kinase KdpD